MARRHTRFVRPPARTKMWIGAGVGSTTMVGSSVQLISSLSAGALLLRPFTILRTHVLIGYMTDQEAADELPTGAYGSIVVTEAAVAVGVTAVPDPSGISGDPEASWFVWQALLARSVLGAGGSAPWGNGFEGVQYEIDSKAMRKVGPDDNIVTIGSTETANGAFLVDQGRRLIQLH